FRSDRTTYTTARVLVEIRRHYSTAPCGGSIERSAQLPARLSGCMLVGPTFAQAWRDTLVFSVLLPDSVRRSARSVLRHQSVVAFSAALDSLPQSGAAPQDIR